MLLLLTLGCHPTAADWPVASVQDTGVAPLLDRAEDEAEPLPAVLINELMADNESSLEDEAGEEEDWVELVVTGQESVDLAGWGLGRDAVEWTFPAGTTLGPDQHLVLFLDGEEDQGPLHLPWRLDADGDRLALFDPDGVVADAWDFGAQGADLVLGRFPDAGPLIAASIVATPGNANPWDPGQSTDPTDLLFPQDRVLVLELQLPEHSWAALEETSDEYVEGAVSLGGVTLAPVGIRIKGQWGSLRDLDQKAAFKVEMNTFGQPSELKGLGKLTLNNMVQDPSLVHERMAYQLFRDMGVPTPRTAHVALYLDGEYRGLYLHVESPDERFLARWFGDDEGNLYEGEYGQDVTLDGYLDLEQDERGSHDPDDYSDLLALATVLDQEPSEDLVADLEAVADVDEWLRAMAVEAVIGHWDGYLWYPNNYRIYHDPSTDLLSLLPWGVDQTFDYEGDVEAADGLFGQWVMDVPSLRARYLREVWRASERMGMLALDVDALDAHAMVLPWFDAGPYEEHSVETSLDYLFDAMLYVQQRPVQLEEELSPWGQVGG